MKYKEFDSYIPDEGEPVMRSCWECNGAHQHLRDVTSLHVCPWCGKMWIFGRFLDDFETAEEMDTFLKARLEAA